MKAKPDCQCEQWTNIINITDWYDEFCQTFIKIDEAPAVGSLLECESCKQNWLAADPSVSNVCYGFRLDDISQWQNFDTAPLIKSKMLQNREGFGEMNCRKSECAEPNINGSIYCLEHLYESGSRV